MKHIHNKGIIGSLNYGTSDILFESIEDIQKNVTNSFKNPIKILKLASNESIIGYVEGTPINNDRIFLAVFEIEKEFIAYKTVEQTTLFKLDEINTVFSLLHISKELQELFINTLIKNKQM